MRRRLFIIAALAGLGVYFGVHPSGAAVPALPKPKPISFNRDIRPLLSENCNYCHGPDASHRKAGLRLDQKEATFAPLKSGDVAVVPGDLEKSALIQRITSNDADEHMPPEESGKKLSAQQIALLKRWVSEGAQYDGLWSFAELKQPEVPETRGTWGRNPIDKFVLARLEEEKLSPSPEADRPTLIRRLSFDLTGLPPTPAEVDAFVADKSPGAYEKVVDRLLASPHYGERMALEWLDAARFADTHGYHIDSGRDMTAWRDWVIKAFNDNKKFDQFTIEQLAGDLMPNATLPQQIASGFQRNAMTNFEGGAVPEEYLAQYQIDRVSTMGAVWMGLTVGCAQCHDHKFDPVTQKDFYRLYAFFNTISEQGLDGQRGNAAPVLPVPNDAQQKQLAALKADAASARAELDGLSPALDAAQAQWEAQGVAALTDRVVWTPVEVASATSPHGTTFKSLPDGSLLAQGPSVAKDDYVISVKLGRSTGIRIEALDDPTLPAHGPGRSENGNFVLTQLRVMRGPTIIKLGAASADFSQESFSPTGAIFPRRPGSKGWAIFPQVGKPHEVIAEFETPFVGGPVDVKLDFHSQFPDHAIGKLRISSTAAPSPRGDAKPPAGLVAALKVPLAQRDAAQRDAVRKWYRDNVSLDCRSIVERYTDLTAQAQALEASFPTTMVMREMDKPRDTFILLRGMYDKHGEKVTPETPAALPPLPTDQPRNRLGLARWLVSASQPLTPRVIVNRYWQMYFGTGIVKTAEDFGMQGEFPSHPELLDWLAAEFEHGGWDVKAMQKLIVTSATYRQSSAASAEITGRDPENRLLSHGPRFRLNAEFIRDQALAVSGLMNPQIGGKSALPYQPAGLWEELMARTDMDNFTAQRYVQDHGRDLYRRGMYTFRKRTSPPPELTVLDAPDRETCTVRRSRTNTPLQALELMNDPTFLEASRKLAEKAMIEGGATPEAKLDFVFKLATARDPKAGELAVLKDVLAQEHGVFAADPKSADKLLAIGESPRNASLDKVDHAAWTMLCSTVLNLDETVTKN